jgi:hypothetical protein
MFVAVRGATCGLSNSLARPGEGGVEGAGDDTGEEAAVEGSEREEKSQDAEGRSKAA